MKTKMGYSKAENGTIDVEEIKDYLKKMLKKGFPYFEWK